MTQDKNKPKLLVHIGYHKTGSTYWQKKVFSTNEVNFIERSLVREHILAPTAYEFSSNSLNQWLKSQLVDNQLNVISEEELSGNIHTAGNGRSITYETIERLSSIDAADVKILIFVRNQVDMIDSCYRQYVKRGGCFSFEKYVLSETMGGERHRFPGFSMAHFLYDDVIEHCFNRFGKNNVLVFSYEDFCSSPSRIVSEISSEIKSELFIEKSANRTRVNQSLSNFTVLLSRLTNRLFSKDPISRNAIFSLNILQPYLCKFYQYLDNILPRKLTTNHYVTNDKIKIINKYYSESNIATQELTGIDLQKLKYPNAERINN